MAALAMLFSSIADYNSRAFSQKKPTSKNDRIIAIRNK